MRKIFNSVLISNSVLLGLIIIYIVVMMFALRVTFATIYENTSINTSDLRHLYGTQEQLVGSMIDLTELVENMADEVFRNQIEIARLKAELELPNEDTILADKIFDSLAEE